MALPPIHWGALTVVGLGVTLMTTFGRYRFPKVPHYISGPGIFLGAGMIIMSLIPGVRLGPAVLGVIGLVLCGVALEWQLAEAQTTTTAHSTTKPTDGSATQGTPTKTDQPRQSACPPHTALCIEPAAGGRVEDVELRGARACGDHGIVIAGAGTTKIVKADEQTEIGDCKTPRTPPH